MSMIKMANALGMDLNGFREYEYQPGHWSHRIWAIGSDYYTMTKGQKPPKVSGRFDCNTWDMQWRAMASSELNIAPEGYTVWTCKAE